MHAHMHASVDTVMGSWRSSWWGGSEEWDLEDVEEEKEEEQGERAEEEASL